MTDDPVAFPVLDVIELGRLDVIGSRRSVSGGEYLFREGDPAYDFYVVVSGAVDILMRTDGADRVVARHGPGRFVGELYLLTGQRTMASAVVAEPGEVLVLGREAFRQMIRTDPGLSDRILAAFLARRTALFSGESAAIRVVGPRFSPELRPVRVCHVTIVVRGPDLNASMSRYLVDRVEAHERVDARSSTSITALAGDQALSTVLVTGKDGDDAIPCAALFSFIGADPSSGWLSGCAALDEKGFVLTDRSLGPEHLGDKWEIFARSPLPFETSHPGLFAVGDVRSGSTKRVAAAVGEGSAAVRSVHEYLDFSQ